MFNMGAIEVIGKRKDVLEARIEFIMLDILLIMNLSTRKLSWNVAVFGKIERDLYFYR